MMIVTDTLSNLLVADVPQNSRLTTRGNLAKIPPNQVIDDFGRGSSIESEFEWCPAGIIERFELFKMASKMATLY